MVKKKTDGATKIGSPVALMLVYSCLWRLTRAAARRLRKYSTARTMRPTTRRPLIARSAINAGEGALLPPLPPSGAAAAARSPERCPPVVGYAPYPFVAEADVEIFPALARAWNASKLLGPDSTALMAKTIPSVQCTGGPCWPQYPQIGAV